MKKKPRVKRTGLLIGIVKEDSISDNVAKIKSMINHHRIRGSGEFVIIMRRRAKWPQEYMTKGLSQER